MLADQPIHKNNNGNFSSIEMDKCTSVENVIKVIKKCIPIFIKSVSTKTDYNENLLTQDLFIECNSYCKYGAYKFSFIPQFIDEKRKSFTNDFATYIDATKEIFFTIEAKRLPNATNSGRNDEDYVYSITKENGGIERFKKNVHGIDKPISGMIGYVQKNDFTYWHKQVNNWIQNKVTKKIKSPKLVWNKNERLQLIETAKNTTYCELKSNHSRINSTLDKFELRHIWINLT